VLRIRWLGRVRYEEALVLQRALWTRAVADYLLLLEHPAVYTLGFRADPGHVLVDPTSVGAELVRTDRGGDVTYHGPGQLIGYPIMSLGNMASARAYVHDVEQLLIDALAGIGLSGAARLPGYPGVWVSDEAGTGRPPRKIAAIGVRISRRRSMHGFALNVDPDLTMFDHIVPCGIRDYGVTSIAEEGLRVTMRDVVDAVAATAAARWGPGERADIAWEPRRRATTPAPAATAPTATATAPTDPAPAPTATAPTATATAPAPTAPTAPTATAPAPTATSAPLALSARKPPWLRAPVRMGKRYLGLKRTMRSRRLVTVCEEAGCPNIFECWGQGTATFMINGSRCTRACGFCLIDTERPNPLDTDEPARVAAAVADMNLAYAVVTAVARDDLPDGGAGAFVATVAAIRERCPGTAVEVLIPDFKGSASALDAVFASRPDVLNHNLETVARLQRVVRPSAGYARSLSVLARAKDAGLVTKSGLILGMGETEDEVLAALADLRNIGVDIVTMGQYLRPSARHLPVHRWVTPDEFEALAERGRALGFAHVEASPLTRSSYHAREAREAAVATPI